MNNEIIIGLLKILVDHRIVPEKYLKYEIIKRDFEKMVAEGITPGMAKEKISENHFISFKRVEDILYKREKNTTAGNINNSNFN